MAGRLINNVSSLDKEETKVRYLYLQQRLNDQANGIEHDPLYAIITSQKFHVAPFQHADIRNKNAPIFEKEYAPIGCFLQAVNHQVATIYWSSICRYILDIYYTTGLTKYRQNIPQMLADMFDPTGGVAVDFPFCMIM